MSSPCTHGASSPADSAATMYFVVFPCGSRPIFHSSRIPASLLYGNDPSPPLLHTDVLFLGPLHAADEVPQQKLQDLAFPFRFGSKNTMLLDESSGGAALENLPLWSAHTEAVCNAKGDVRHYRLAVVSNFVVHVSSHSGQLHTMQTKHAATAIVVTVPPHTPYYSYLLDQFSSVVRGMLHITLVFAMETTRYFFARLNRLTPLRELEQELLSHPSAAQTCHTLRAVLVNALSPRYAVPRLHSRAGEVRLQLPPRRLRRSADAAERTAPVEDHLHRALHTLHRFSDEFASRVVVGMLSLSDWGGYGLVRGADAAAPDPYAAYWREVEAAQAPPRSPTLLESPSRRHRHSRRVGRVVVFCTDTDVAHAVLVLAAFFFRDARAARSERPVRGGLGGEAVRVAHGEWTEAPFAAQVSTCAHPSLPVQWMDEEYTPKRVDSLLYTPYTVDNTLLLIAPRGMICQRLRLQKTFSSNTIHVEKASDCVPPLPPLQPFRCRVLEEERVLPDETVRVALREALSLYERSGGKVSCAEFLEDFIVCLAMRFRTHSVRLTSMSGHSEQWMTSPLEFLRRSKDDIITNEEGSLNGVPCASVAAHDSAGKSPKPFVLPFYTNGAESRLCTPSLVSATVDGMESRSPSLSQSLMNEDIFQNECFHELPQLMRWVTE